MYGYGAGAGTGGVGTSSARGEGGGGGGVVRAVPVGVIEVSDQQTRFVPITDRKRLAGAVLAGIGLGMLLGWRSHLLAAYRNEPIGAKVVSGPSEQPLAHRSHSHSGDQNVG
jgi:hypothetical protein